MRSAFSSHLLVVLLAAGLILLTGLGYAAAASGQPAGLPPALITTAPSGTPGEAGTETAETPAPTAELTVTVAAETPVAGTAVTTTAMLTPTMSPAAATASAATNAYWAKAAPTASPCITPTQVPAGGAAPAPGLWEVYNQALRGAKYVDLTHTITPKIPVWAGFGPPTFYPTIDPTTGKPYLYSEGLGFEATHYDLTTDQLGTQLDPPAHWAPEYPAIDELPATYAVRPLVVISIEDQVAQDRGYALQVKDITDWEARNGRVPEGSVVMVRSGWSKDWPDPKLATLSVFPGVSLDALKFLHGERHILFHGHEPLDTDATPTLEGESWLMHNGYTQAEGVANLDHVPETGCLIAIGYPKFQGGTGGYARYIAICPPDWQYGVTIDEAPGAPLPKSDKILQWDAGQARVRK